MKQRAFLPAVAVFLFALPAAAQDVEMLGRVYGTRPPSEYLELRARDPDAFRFERAWSARSGLPLRAAPDGAGGDPAPLLLQDAPSAVLGSRGAVVAGTFHVPLLLGLFADSPEPPFSRAQVAGRFFGDASGTGTITDYYREVSGGRVELLGETFGWRRADLTGAQVAGGASGLGGSSRVGEFIMQLLVPLRNAVDWGRFDNDGPDGVPNSGDDDGYVDVLAVMHPTEGAECDADYDLVWSHRWTLSSALGSGQAFRTGTPSALGGVIRVNDYTIQPVQACDPVGTLNQIGVFAHELGHAFGLPDLYATGDVEHAGIGRWGLMGSGSWGCGAAHEPERPCHLSAWSKAALGWVDVVTLPADADLGTITLEPVEISQRVLRVDAGDGSGEYFLLENRQRIGYDASLTAPGLLVWHVDPGRIEQRWAVNAVNADGRHLGIWLRQADGRDDLERRGGNRGDAGDPFPGVSGATAFHAGTAPASRSHRGTATGVTLLDVALSGQQVRFRALTRYQDLRLSGAGPSASFVVDGDTLPPGDRSVPTAPFQQRVVSAPAGAPVREGVRLAFTAWSDDAGAERTRTWTMGLEDAALGAIFEGAEQVRLRVRVEGDSAGIAPGSIELTPASEDGWYEPGIEVAVHAEPRAGFAFLGWGGEMAGRPNPALVPLDAPVDATAVFEQTFGVAESSTLTLEAASPVEVVLQATDGTPPYAWSVADGRLPRGMRLDGGGTIEGAALETGSFPLTVQAVDAIGLLARASLTLEVSAPVLGLAALTDAFFLRPASLTGIQQVYLDRAGNDNGVYDLGDFRAWVLGNPDLPMTAAEAELVRTLLPLVDFRRGGGR